MRPHTRELLIVPDFTPEACLGQLRLNEIIRQADLLTGVLTGLREEGFKVVTLEQILRRAKDLNLLAKGFTAADFSYTGKRVIPNDESFFKWYATTVEGQTVKERLESCLPGSFGRFAKITINLD